MRSRFYVVNKQGERWGFDNLQNATQKLKQFESEGGAVIYDTIEWGDFENMRSEETKFRHWDSDHQEWVYPSDDDFEQRMADALQPFADLYDFYAETDSEFSCWVDAGRYRRTLPIKAFEDAFHILAQHRVGKKKI